MKRNLILSLALLAVSIPSFAATSPKPCDNNKQDSSMQSKEKDQKHNKKEKKQKKDKTEQQQDNTGFSIYG